MSPTQQEIEHAASRIAELGPAGAMREMEELAGRVIIRPGVYPWFSSEKWGDDDFLSLDGKRCRIVLVNARVTGHGAFSRMIDGILNEGWKPVVIEPMNRMQAILSRWGWHSQRVGKGFDGEWHWYPSVVWIQQRRLRAP